MANFYDRIHELYEEARDKGQWIGRKNLPKCAKLREDNEMAGCVGMVCQMLKS